MQDTFSVAHALVRFTKSRSRVSLTDSDLRRAKISKRGLEESLLKLASLVSSLTSDSDFLGSSTLTGLAKTKDCESELSLPATKGLNSLLYLTWKSFLAAGCCQGFASGLNWVLEGLNSVLEGLNSTTFGENLNSEASLLREGC